MSIRSHVRPLVSGLERHAASQAQSCPRPPVRQRLLHACIAALLIATPLADAGAADLYLQASRSTLLKPSRPMGEVIVADPTVADVRAHGNNQLSVVGKRAGVTTLSIFDRDRHPMLEYDVYVGYDLVAIRRALKNFLPDELIGVEMVNTNIALTGSVSSAAAADKAVRIVSEFTGITPEASAPPDPAAASALAPSAGAAPADKKPGILNLMQVTSGQQVMLRVRVGEVQRDALRKLGIDLNSIARMGAGDIFFGTGGGIASLVAPSSTSEVSVSPGQFLLPGGRTPVDTQGILGSRYMPDGVNGDVVAGQIKALERDGLFKLLAEPNLVAVSGEQAEFLAGGEIPVPVPQVGSGSTSISVEYKPFGVAVRFKPFVLSENRIRMEVQPEVSELDSSNAVKLNDFVIPAITTRRAKTVVELAPGESFMIAGLMKDQVRSSIDQLPGIKELPILGALFRSTSFQRSESELVIAVTPYMVDPMKSTDVRLPTDNFAPASQMDMIFYGAIGSLSGNASRLSQSPSVEGPIGFMVD